MSISQRLTVLLVLVSLFLPSPGKASEIAGNLVIAGNGPEQSTMEALARAFEKANPRAYVDLLWDDHSKPLELVQAGQAHIAVTGAEHPPLAATQIGWDGIGILVHLSNFTATRLLSSFSSKVVGDHKPGFAEIKAAAMNNERMERFAKLPPLNAKRNVPPPNTSFDSNTSAGTDSGSEQ
ncbi:MAG: hypothetical protein HP492_04200 [Nitrospira sp.]|nr:hypothetical protein [Nitrospira sp.]